jgi:outer membrane protein assembly factor BamB
VALGDRVYATLSLDGPVTCVAADTGRTLKTYPETENTEEILLSGDTLFVLTGPGSLGDGGRLLRPVEERTIKALHAATGTPHWQHTDVVAATTLAVDGAQAYYFNFDSRRVTCLDRRSGALQWHSPPLPSPPKQTSFFASKLVVQDGVVLFAGGEFSGMTKSGGGETRADTLTALESRTGDILWQAEHPPSGYSSPENLWVIDGTVWCDSSSNGTLDGTVVGLDLRTGEVRHRFAADEKNYWFHHRCYAGRATTRYLMTSRTGIEFVDLDSRKWDLNHWVRGACLYGIMPCNGLIYTPPAPCICYAESYLHSFNAFAPAPDDPIPAERALDERLFVGPAYQRMANHSTGNPHPEDWPTYRRDNARSGYNPTTLPTRLRPLWQARLDGRLSSLTVAQGLVYVAAIDRHTVHALDMHSGQQRWQFTAGGRVDSPPTTYRGRILFGSADGHVYCLDADTGELVWRFQAAPRDRRLLVYEQMESVWPVHGSVLVEDGIAHFVAGRSLFVDTGMRYYRVDVASGRVISRTVLDDRHPQTGESIQESVKWLNMPVGRPDILSCDGPRIYMRSQAFDLEGNRLNMEIQADGPTLGTYQEDPNKHLFCPTGFLDDTWFHRTYWLYGSTWGSGWCGYYIAGKFAPAGKIMSVGRDHVYSFGRQPEYYKWTLPLEYRLFAARKQWSVSADAASNKKDTGKPSKNKVPGPYPIDNTGNYAWSRDLPILARAMTATERVLVVAGPRDVLPENSPDRDNEVLIRQQEAGFQGKNGALLWVIGTQDGQTLAEYTLDSPPVFDGLAAARGRLYISMMDGTVACWE